MARYYFSWVHQPISDGEKRREGGEGRGKWILFLTRELVKLNPHPDRDDSERK